MVLFVPVCNSPFCCRKYLQTGLSLECRSVCNLFLCKPVDTYNKLLSLYTKKVERSRTFNKIMMSTRYSNTFHPFTEILAI